MKNWPDQEVSEALIEKRIDPRGMERLLEVTFLGGGSSDDLEKARPEEIEGKPQKAKSQQLEETFERLAGGEFVPPQYDPTVWAQTPKMSTRLARCIRSYARNTVGLGWSVEPLKPHSARDASQDRDTPDPAKPERAEAPPPLPGDPGQMSKAQIGDGPEGGAPDGPAGASANGRANGRANGAARPELSWDGWGGLGASSQSAAESADRELEKARKREKREIEWQTEALRELFEYPNDAMPFTEVMFLVKTDEETVGNGYLEIVRNNVGRITQMLHVPAVTVRRRLMRSSDANGQKYEMAYGYIQIRGAQKKYFKEFGDGRVMDAYSGKWHDGGEPLEIGRRATEIIHFPIYDPTSQYYGAPRYVPSATAIAGNRQSAMRNVAFFENDAVPRMALLVSGGRLTGDSMQQVEDFVRGKARGTDQAHRVMIIQVEPHKVGFQQQNKVMVELKPLTVGVTEDASFSNYRKDNDEEIREIFGLGQIFFTSEGANRANAQVAREITNEQEFEPDRLAKEYILNQTIVCDLLGHLMQESADLNRDGRLDEDELRRVVRRRVRVRFRFARMSLTDPMDQARADQIYASLGAVTPNELRERLGKPPFPEEFFFADKPLSVAMAELSAGLALAIAVNPEQKPPQQPGEEGAPGGAADITPEMPQKFPGVGGPSLAAAMEAPFAEGIEVTGSAAGGTRSTGTRNTYPAARRPGLIRLPPTAAFQIASELLADARRLAMMDTRTVEREDDHGA